ncbi:MAG: lipopolysaccharide biosynthesis protein [Acidimicrobiales bacterium]
MTSQPSNGTVNPTARLQLGRDAGYVFGAQALAIALGFTLNAVAARTFEPTEFAALAWALTWLAWLALCAQLGLMQAGTVIMALEGQAGFAHRLRTIVVTLLVNAVIVSLLWWLLIGPLVAGASEDESAYRSVIGGVAWWVPVAAVAPVIAGVLRGLHRFRDAAFYGEYVRRILLLGALAIVVIGDFDRTAITVIAIAVVAESVIALGVVVALDRSARGDRLALAQPPAMNLRRRALAFVLPTIDAPLLPQAGVWVLALVRPATEVAVLSVGIGISFLFGLPVFVGARVLGPRYARMHSEGRSLRPLEPIARRHALLSLIFVAAGTLGLVIFGEWAVALVFGDQYQDAATVAAIIGVGAMINAATGSCAAALMHCEQERLVGITAVIAAVSYLGLALVLGNEWGANGVAAAAALVVSSRNLYLVGATKRRLGLTTWVGRPRTSTDSPS